ncbi:conserved hypothetical protein [uncultured Mycobacterium sp.]|uniref:Uncharacterized protein n=1 Tax=uncultured Mycobacterium sp. TaxID=171292 RepID=A0A1Y5PKJ0_9MYCO|nr:conserved hypothetical protein [uncultured Mycobacterium sp.]
MPTRTLGVALWEYRDRNGCRRRAYYRETFELPDSEVERGERASVFEPAVGRISDATPPKTSTNRLLVDWLVEHRHADRDAIKTLTKAQLWQRIEDSEGVVSQQDSPRVST